MKVVKLDESRIRPLSRRWGAGRGKTAPFSVSGTGGSTRPRSIFDLFPHASPFHAPQASAAQATNFKTPTAPPSFRNCAVLPPNPSQSSKRMAQMRQEQEFEPGVETRSARRREYLYPPTPDPPHPVKTVL